MCIADIHWWWPHSHTHTTAETGLVSCSKLQTRAERKWVRMEEQRRGGESVIAACRCLNTDFKYASYDHIYMNIITSFEQTVVKTHSWRITLVLHTHKVQGHLFVFDHRVQKRRSNILHQLVGSHMGPLHTPHLPLLPQWVQTLCF